MSTCSYFSLVNKGRCCKSMSGSVQWQRQKKWILLTAMLLNSPKSLDFFFSRQKILQPFFVTLRKTLNQLYIKTHMKQSLNITNIGQRLNFCHGAVDGVDNDADTFILTVFCANTRFLLRKIFHGFFAHMKWSNYDLVFKKRHKLLLWRIRSKG